MRPAIILALLFVASAPVFGQIQIDAGASTLYGGTAGGFGLTTYTNGGQQYAGVAFLGGKIVPGAWDQFSIRGVDLTAGSQNVSFSFDGAGVGLSLVGVSIRKTTADKRTHFVLFAGATGAGYFLPFASATLPSHIGFGGLWERDFELSEKSRLRFSSLDLLAGGSKTAAQGFAFTHADNFKLVGSAGLLNNSKYANGSASWKPVKRLTIFADHADYFSPIRAEGSSAGASLTLGFLSVQAGLNSSTSAGVHSTGENGGASFRVGPITATTNFYKSTSQSGSRTLVSHLLTERLSPRITVTENINQSGGRNSYSFGGSYTGRRAQFSVTHSVQFLLNGAGYQNTTAVSVSFRVRDTVVSASTITDPFGRTRWSAGAESFVQANLPGVRGDANHTGNHGGKYLINGRCETEDKTPVEGCAIRVGGAEVYSNTRGEFSLHVKKSTSVAVLVPVEAFVAPGTYIVVSAPTFAEPTQPVTVVVKRCQ